MAHVIYIITVIQPTRLKALYLDLDLKNAIEEIKSSFGVFFKKV